VRRGSRQERPVGPPARRSFASEATPKNLGPFHRVASIPRRVAERAPLLGARALPNLSSPSPFWSPAPAARPPGGGGPDPKMLGKRKGVKCHEHVVSVVVLVKLTKSAELVRVTGTETEIQTIRIAAYPAEARENIRDVVPGAADQVGRNRNGMGDEAKRRRRRRVRTLRRLQGNRKTDAAMHHLRWRSQEAGPPLQRMSWFW
jgi:hypothetical protein